MLDPLIIVLALCCGLLARMAGMPALIGYLAGALVYIVQYRLTHG